MIDPVSVRMIEGLSDPGDQVGFFRERRLMLSTPISWLGPFDEFGGEVERRSVAAEFQELDNSGMPQPSRRPCLLKKALDSIGLLHPIRMENLESDVARQR